MDKQALIAEITLHANKLADDALDGHTWKRGKAGGSAAQKEYADNIIRNGLAGTAATTAIVYGWEEASARVAAAIKKIDRNASSALDMYASQYWSDGGAEKAAESYLVKAERKGWEIKA